MGFLDFWPPYNTLAHVGDFLVHKMIFFINVPLDMRWSVRCECHAWLFWQRLGQSHHRCCGPVNKDREKETGLVHKHNRRKKDLQKDHGITDSSIMWCDRLPHVRLLKISRRWRKNRGLDERIELFGRGVAQRLLVWLSGVLAFIILNFVSVSSCKVPTV